MKVATSHDPDASLNEFFRKILQELITENFPVNELKTIDECLQEFVKLDRMILTAIDQTVAPQLFSQLHEIIKTT